MSDSYGRLWLYFFAVTIPVLGVVTLLSGAPEPFLGAVIAGAIMVPFAYILEALD